ncbi:MAG: DUF5320 domain-containing protein [Patescibacteria group bacterium]|nr:DUF5320 domain-containing protein [Patescibacteria group bacterium]
MPQRDRTGPMGMGSKTGRGMGPCREGYGLGRGYRTRLRGFQGMNEKDKKEMLKDEAQCLKENLKEIEEELSEMEE